METKSARPTREADTESERSSVARIRTIGFSAITAKVASNKRRGRKILSATRAAQYDVARWSRTCAVAASARVVSGEGAVKPVTAAAKRG